MMSRRNILAAAAAIPALALPITATAACTSTAPSAEWLAVVGRLDNAVESAVAYHDAVFSSAHKAWKQAKHAAEWELERQIEAIPHYVTTNLIDIPHGDGTRTLSTARQMDVLVAERFSRHPNLAGEDQSFVRACAELHPQAVARCRRAEEMRSEFQPPVIDPAIHAENKRREDIAGDAFGDAVDFEPRTLGDLIAKVAFLKEQECEVDHDHLLKALRLIAGEV